MGLWRAEIKHGYGSSSTIFLLFIYICEIGSLSDQGFTNTVGSWSVSFRALSRSTSSVLNQKH